MPEGGQVGVIHGVEGAVCVGDRYWVEWFVGFEQKRKSALISADEFLPELLRMARSLNKELQYVDACLALR